VFISFPHGVSSRILQCFQYQKVQHQNTSVGWAKVHKIAVWRGSWTQPPGVLRESERHCLRVLKNPIKSLRLILGHWECQDAERCHVHTLKEVWSKLQSLKTDTLVDGMNMMVE